MKKNLLFLLFSLIVGNFCYAQSIETGVELYEEGDYERALRILDNHDEPIAHLFSGKSHFSMGNYLKAKHELAQVDSSAFELFLEAKYTRALADFQLKNFTQSLDALYEIKSLNVRGSVINDANSFYNQLLKYLNLDQRFKAFKASKHDDVRLDLVEAAIGNVGYASANSLFNLYQRTTTTEMDSARFRNLYTLLSDSLEYWEKYNPQTYPDAPEGISYNIGVALPEFAYESPEFEITQKLYFGIQLAVENFNSENTDKKVFITYKNTADGASSAEFVVNDLVWNYDTDAIIGPLFSDVAVQFSKYAELYEIPLLTPLANSDTLNLDLSYTFQLNPTFGIHGKKMARYAIQNLRFDTLAVIAEKGSLGAASAVAFRDEARELGAEVVHYFVEDLESKGYDISEYTTYLDPKDTVYNYNIDAIYAPFTGEVASTLINSLLTHLEAMQSPVAILGSEMWRSINMESLRLPYTQVYYTESFSSADNENMMEKFDSSFRLRFNVEPNFYAYIGYDAANILLETLKKVKNPVYLKEGLKSLNNYQGLQTDVSFRNTHINQEVKVRNITQ